MNILNRLERKIGWLAVGNLPLYLVTAQAILFLWCFVNPGDKSLLIFDPVAVFEGREVWRILTFLFVIPTQNLLFAFFYLYLMYVYGQVLEEEWGSFAFTLYYVVGALGTLAAAVFFGNASGGFFLNLTLFLAFAALHGDFELYLFFILPVKIKWLAWATWAWLLYNLMIYPFFIKISILVSLANYFLFFGSTHFDNVRNLFRRYQYRRKFKDWQNK